MNVKRGVLGYFVGLSVFVIVLVIGLFNSYADNNISSINRFNVVLVLDASNSMNYTDPQGLRYEAIGQFTSLLAEKGNYLGGVVFSNHIGAQTVPNIVNDQTQKNNVTDLLKSVTSQGVNAEMGYTNIGEALSAATDMLIKSGNPDLPSVIVFLSDGNTEMPTEEEQVKSLDEKANAIQKARENNIKIYSICLNANKKADIAEMNQISNATGGTCEEVNDASNLQDVFNTFYSLIYGTSATALFDDVIPASGKIEIPFDVPSLGVEEVNIIINGSAKEFNLFNPNGESIDAVKVSSETFTIIKILDITPGEWRLETKGIPGDNVKINMIYNTDLGIDVTVEPKDLKLKPGDKINITAKLKSGDNYAKTDSEYTGYNAILQILDAYGSKIDSVPMSVEGGELVASYELKDGTYFVNIDVIGNGLEKSSSKIGPINVTDGEDDAINNTSPEANKTPVKKVVYIWPLKSPHLSIDMSSLVKNPKDDMRYEIVSSSFIKDKDYVVDNDIIEMDHFSLSKGSFDVKVTNVKGLSCNIEVIVKSYNVGIMACIGIAIVIVIALIIILINIWYWSRKPFRGSIKVTSYCNGEYRENTRKPKRGKCKLAVFQIAPVGIDYNKSYFQATGKQFIWLNTNVPVMCNGQKTTKIQIQSGVQTTINFEDGSSKYIYVYFDSNIKRPVRGRR